MIKSYNALALLGVCGFLFSGCEARLEKKLLETKSYFENTFVSIEVRGEEAVTYTLTTRSSSPVNADAKITYRIGDNGDVEDYNRKNGTKYLLFPAEGISIPDPEGKISKGNIYTSPVDMVIEGLDKVEEGQTYLIPVRFNSDSSVPAIASSQTMYLALHRPTQIKTVRSFLGSSYNGFINVPRMSDFTFESVTYEALVYAKTWNDNNTVMGLEGSLIFRIGDEGGGLDRNKLQIAGNKQFHYDTGLETQKWYHLAFTFNHDTGKAIIYVNGEAVTSGDWDQIADIREGFAIGQVPHFMWGNRPFTGYMSEVRLWNVARTQKELQQGMLRVDPNSEGLVFYYHLNGEDVVQGEDGLWSVLDASGHGLDGIPNDGYYSLGAVDLEAPLEAKDILK